MPIQVLYFASIRTRLERDSESFDLPSPPTLSALKTELLDRYRGDATIRELLTYCMWSVGDLMVEEEDEHVVLKEGDVVAVIPPVSGG